MFAAASLTGAFTELGDAFTADHPDGEVTFNFAASSELVSQIAEGAPADLFASADQNNMTKLTDAGNSASDPVVFANNVLEIIVAPGNPLELTDIATVVGRKARLGQRQPGAGAQLLLFGLLARAGLPADSLPRVAGEYTTGSDLAQAVRSGRADCGVASRAVAEAAGLDFLPLIWERFDLVLRQRDYFRAGPQALFDFIRTEAFRERARELGGYDATGTGAVRFAA